MARMKPGNKLAGAMRQGLQSPAPELHPATIGSAELCCALGEQRLGEERPADALGYFQRAVELDPGSVHGWFGQGISCSTMKEFAAALEFYRRAIELDPALAIAHHNLGRSLHETGQAELAYESFKNSLALGFEPTRKDLAIFIPGCPSADNRTVLAERMKWADGLRKAAGGDRKPCAPERDGGKTPLKVGYVSAFFHKDNWMKVVWGLIAEHDREKVQVHLFSDRAELTPAIQAHLRPGDGFHDMGALSNDEAAGLIAGLGIDILVDLNGHSFPQRFALFLNRPAPLVIAWFNVYATTGFDCFDYLVGDDCAVAAGEEQWYCEKIARVPGSYLAFGVAYDVPGVSAPPCMANGYVTFGSLISQYKITGQVIDAWCGILRGVGGSRLLVRNAALGKASNRQYLRAEFTRRGMDAERILLEGPAPHFEFLETYGRIDIALDAFPYNGGTTTIEALWQGVPVVAFRGDRWASRTSATLLLAGGLDELLAADADGYVRLARRLAGDPQKLAAMRRGMRDRLSKSRLCDTAGLARSMETLYRELWESQDAG